MVSSLVVIFSVVELLLLPVAAQMFLWTEPLVAAAWMGLAVKTDGAAVACGAITEALILARAGEAGIHYKAGWMVATTTTVKIFIDVFIGIWAFVLALAWAYGIDKKKGQPVPIAAILQRFPKFVAGYALGFAGLLTLAADAAEPGQRPQGGHRGHGPFPPAVFRDDLFHDRPGGELQKALGGGIGPAGPGVRG